MEKLIIKELKKIPKVSSVERKALSNLVHAFHERTGKPHQTIWTKLYTEFFGDEYFNLRTKVCMLEYIEQKGYMPAFFTYAKTRLAEVV